MLSPCHLFFHETYFLLLAKPNSFKLYRISRMTQALVFLFAIPDLNTNIKPASLGAAIASV